MKNSFFSYPADFYFLLQKDGFLEELLMTCIQRLY